MALIPEHMELTPEAAEVLRHAGIADPGDLARAKVNELQRIFFRASEEGRFVQRFPSLKMFAAWIDEARAQSGVEEVALEDIGHADLHNIPTATVLRSGSKVEPLAAGYTPDQPIRPPRVYPVAGQPTSSLQIQPRRQESPESPLKELNPEKDLTLFKRKRRNPLRKPSAARPPVPPDGSPPPGVAAVAAAPAASPQGSSPRSPFSSFDDYKRGSRHVRPLDRRRLEAGEDLGSDTAEEQAAFEEEEAYKRRMPRTQIRGVQYPDPLRFVLGSLTTILLHFCFAALIAGSVIIPLWFSGERMILAWLALALAGAGLLYLVLGVRVRCRVCSCHFFFSRPCFKHAKAHRILGGLPTLCLAVHGLLFRWFRCMYCGTAIRLSARKDE
ncbi:MAG TPA: DUF4332 domain-containing protein [Verrucomicrobiales bacterium]|nr:DUF4332 domain-containing protein [Verrucomicrobiales bacterium]